MLQLVSGGRNNVPAAILVRVWRRSRRPQYFRDCAGPKATLLVVFILPVR
jgi:hypothetical protein